MLKKILEDAIGKDATGFNSDREDGYNLAKAEMRAKIPKIVDEVVWVISECRLPQNTSGKNGVTTLMYIENEDFNIEVNKRLEWIIKSITVDNSQEKDNK